MYEWAEYVLYVIWSGYIFMFENISFQIPGLSNKYYMVLLISCDYFAQIEVCVKGECTNFK